MAVVNIGTADINGSGVAAATVGSAIAAGSLVVVLVSDFNSSLSTFSVTDTQHNTYTLATTPQNAVGVGSALIFYSFVTTPLTTSDTVTYLGTGSSFGAMTVAATTGYGSIDNATTNTGSDFNSVWSISGAGTPAVANEIYFCLMVVNGFSITGNGTELNIQSGDTYMYPAYIVNSGTGNETFSGTCTLQGLVNSIVSFKPTVVTSGSYDGGAAPLQMLFWM